MTPRKTVRDRIQREERRSLEIGRGNGLCPDQFGQLFGKGAIGGWRKCSVHGNPVLLKEVFLSPHDGINPAVPQHRPFAPLLAAAGVADYKDFIEFAG